MEPIKHLADMYVSEYLTPEEHALLRAIDSKPD